MGTLTRLPDWQPRLRSWLRGIGNRQIEPGRHDCCLFGAGAVEALTGVDLAAPWRGRYTTYRGGFRILRKAGYRDHVDLIARHLDEAVLAEALAGDIAIVPTDDGDAVGVFQGSAIYVLTSSGRLGFAPVPPMTTIFKVR